MLHNRQRFESWLPALFDGQFHWDFLAPCFAGTKIQLMDIDAVVERNGHVLKFETKDPGTPIKLGQSLTLTNEWRMGSSILHVEGKEPKSISGYAMYAAHQFDPSVKVGERDITPADAFDLIYVVRRWFCWANGDPAPSREDWDRELWLWDYGRHE